MCGGAALSGMVCGGCQAELLTRRNGVCWRWLPLVLCEAVVPSLCPRGTSADCPVPRACSPHSARGCWPALPVSGRQLSGADPSCRASRVICAFASKRML